MRFFLLFHNTPLTPAIPLKALTSQGMRLDVACRMLRACVLGPNGSPSGHSVSAWFSTGGREAPAVVLHIDGHALNAHVVADYFRSELVLARYLKAIVAVVASGKGMDIDAGFKLEVLDGATSVPDAFLESIKHEKQVASKKVVLFLEQGKPILDLSRSGMITWKEILGGDDTIVIGNHQGFPANVEEALLSISDHVFSIGISEPRDDAGQVSYLGSHVVTFVQMLNLPA